MIATPLMGVVDRGPLDQAGHAKLPWDEPGFSQRMLVEHLDQRHDMASRQFGTIDAHVTWMCDELLAGRPGSVLDLGCGPGLYTERLAAMGCTCRGVDFSPSSIEYARNVAAIRLLPCTYVLGDLMTADLGSKHDLAIFLFGELNTFPRSALPTLLGRIHDSLRPGGHVVVEVHTRESVVAAGAESARWYTSSGGLFAPGPHVVLSEQKWVEERGVTNIRYFVVDATSGRTSEYGETLTAYTDADYQRMLTRAGFVDIERPPGMAGAPHPDMQVITAVAGREHPVGLSGD